MRLSTWEHKRWGWDLNPGHSCSLTPSGLIATISLTLTLRVERGACAVGHFELKVRTLGATTQRALTLRQASLAGPETVPPNDR